MNEDEEIFDIRRENLDYHKLPQRVMMDKFEGIYGRDWKRFLDSIEWDTWCKHETEEEREERLEQIRLANHPFSKWF